MVEQIRRWLSAGEIYEHINQLNNSDMMVHLYGLSLFVNEALYTANFELDERWKDYVELSEAGHDLIGVVHKAGLSFPDQHERFALFRIFYHHDLLIDYERTDTEGILSLLRESHQSESCKWPYFFGNMLYHKFNDICTTNRTDHLDGSAAEKLLDGTPQGIFQIGRLLSGPLGFIKSEECRVIEPRLKLALWHCSDPGCMAQHIVELRQHEIDCQTVTKNLIRYIVDNLGPFSEWHKSILRFSWKGKWPNGRPYCDISAIIGDCIIGGERASLLLRALKSKHNTLLMNEIETARDLRGKPEEVVEQLQPEEQHQLLLLLRDDDLVKYIDELVARKDIRIPPAELRKQKTYVPRYVNARESELSELGLRSPGHPPMIELSATIWNTYERLGLSSDLAWLARGHEGSSIRHTVIDFMRTHGPEAAISELILPSRAVTEAIADEIYFQILPDEDEEITCRRFLWKFGFDIARYEVDYAILRKRIGEFQKCILELGSQLSEDDRAKVRSFGVNLFVSVETFLENLLCYNSWLLSSDHFSGAKFSYDKVDSLLSVGKILGDELVSGDETVKWSNNGSNTMGTLLAYLQAFRNWLKGRRDADKSGVVRAEEDFPHYAEDTFWIFPFKHTQLWADASPEVMAAYSELFDGICTQLAQADLPTVRNGLDHKREEEGFPETDRMLACASRIQQVLDIADNKRLIPKLFWETRRERDANENTCHMLLDYRGNTVTLWSPSTVAAQTRMVSSVPCLVAPFDFLNQPNSTLQFTVSTGSTYKEYWKNYPRRRVIPSEACGTLVPEKANTEGNVST